MRQVIVSGEGSWGQRHDLVLSINEGQATRRQVISNRIDARVRQQRLKEIIRSSVLLNDQDHMLDRIRVRNFWVCVSSSGVLTILGER